MKIRNYQDLNVWQKSMDLACAVYEDVKRLPKEELHALSNQMRRAATSIPSNISEGQARGSTKEFVNFLSIARGSNAELQTQIILCKRLDFIPKENVQSLLDMSYEVGRMLSSLIVSLNDKDC